MRESEFIEQNKQKWLDFENSLNKENVDPAETTRLFVQISDDLSYANTFFPSRSIRSYLDESSRILHSRIKRPNKLGIKKVLHFWKEGLPITIYHSRKQLLISFVIFVISFVIGVLSARNDRAFSESILTSGYLDMTDENIKSGDPMAVYKKSDPLPMFTKIFYNNIRVDLITFLLGIAFSAGSFVIMILNGVMVGVFQYYFINKGVFWESFLGIWTHGCIEIPTIILSGCAGMLLGKGLLYPGTFTRFQAFKLSALKGLKIIIGVAPLTFIAAFVESFITRHTETHDAIRLTFILICTTAIVYYFVVYPFKKGKTNKEEPDPIDERQFTASKIIPVEFHEAGSFASFLAEYVKGLIQSISSVIYFIMGIAVLCSILYALNPFELFRSTQYSTAIQGHLFYANNSRIQYVLISIVLTAAYYKLSQHASLLFQPHKKRTLTFNPSLLLLSLLNVLLLVFLYNFSVNIPFVLFNLIAPVSVYLCVVSSLHEKPIVKQLDFAFTLIQHRFGRFILITFANALLMLLFEMVLTFVLKNFLLLYFVNILFALDEDQQMDLHIGVTYSIYAISTFLAIYLSAVSSTVFVGYAKEVYSAENLKQRILSLTKKQ